MLKWEENSLLSNYCKKFSKANLWKVEMLGYEWDDLYQECYIVYDRCAKKYSGLDDAQFMAKFKKSLQNRIIKLTQKNKEEKLLRENLFYYMEETIEDPLEKADFNITVSMAPPLVKKAVGLINNPPKTIIDKLGQREFRSNKFFCACLGVSPKHNNILEVIKNYFS